MLRYLTFSAPALARRSTRRLLLITCLQACLLLTARAEGGSNVDGRISSHHVDRAAAEASTGRRVERLNNGWQYREGDPAKLDMVRQSSAWVPVTLPHTWNRFDSVDPEPGYRRDASWYRKVLEIPQQDRRLRNVLLFEAANMSADVYVNGRLAGQHVGGYVGFEVDITPHLGAADTTELLVRVDNSYEADVIPSQKSDFVLFGGLTRDVWLKVMPRTSISHIKVATPAVSREEAQTVVTVAMHAVETKHDVFSVVARLVGPNGTIASQVREEIALNGGDTSVSLTMPVVRDPVLWSPETPNQYSVEVDLIRGDELVDAATDRYGYRWFSFEPHGAFYLNGERLLLRGTHRHEEHAGYGAAMPDSLHRRDLEMIKEMGANFVRLAHYPQDPEVYRAANDLGLLVWDELPWCRGGVGGPVWMTHTERLLREMITQHFNHPSIILWSLGNEMYWLPDHPNGGDTTAINFALRHLHGVARALDPGRPTTMRKYPEGAHIVDVYSPSIWSGWYGGSYRQYESAIRRAQAEHPRMLHVEYGGDSHVGRHTETPIGAEQLGIAGGTVVGPDGGRTLSVALDGDWSESYIVDLFDWHLRVSESIPDLTGNAQWNFKDFATPLRPDNPIPYVNQKGLLDRSGRPKDAYYVFKSYWTTDPAFCYIQSHTWTHREGPTGVPLPVRAYCNTESARLLHNGIDLGLRTKDIEEFPASGLVWDVPFAEGDNLLVAIGYSGSETVASDTVTVNYASGHSGPMADIRLSAHPLPTGRVLIQAVAFDADGRRSLGYQERVYFSHDGDGYLLTDYGTPQRSRVIEMANGTAAIEFAPEPGGQGVIEVRNQDFKGAYLRLGPGFRAEGVQNE